MFSAEIRYVSWVAEEVGYYWIEDVDEGARRRWDEEGMPIFRHEYGGLKNLDVRDYLRKRTHQADKCFRFTPRRGLLTEAFDVRDENQMRRYRPCEPLKDNPTAYREFAGIPWRDHKAVVRFASKYGMLESEPVLDIPAYRLPEGVYVRGRKFDVPVDTEEDWFLGSARIRSLIRVWENLDNETALNQLFWWGADHFGVKGLFGWHWRPHPDDGAASEDDRVMGLSSNRVNPNYDFMDYRDGDCVYPAEWSTAPYRWVGTESLKEVAIAHIHQELAVRLSDAEKFQLRVCPPSEGKLSFQVVPNSMLDAFYIQFGQAYQNDKIHRQCRVCGKWFELTPKDRGKREFCSDPCKFKDYRERKQKALDLSAHGKRAAQIADEINTSLETVKTWLKKKDG